MVSKDFLKSYSPFYSNPMEAKDPKGLVNLEPRSMAGIIYVGDHQTLLSIYRVHTDLAKQNSLTFPWLFPDTNPNFPDITVLAGETWFYSNLCL